MQRSGKDYLSGQDYLELLYITDSRNMLDFLTSKRRIQEERAKKSKKCKESFSFPVFERDPSLSSQK